MVTNSLHCTVLNQALLQLPNLVSILNHWDGKLEIEILEDNEHLAKQSVINSTSDLIITGVLDKDQLAQYKRMLHEHSAHTLLVTQSSSASPIQTAPTGIEYCSLSQVDPSSNYTFVSNLLSYIQLKQRFRHCKQLLYITDQRNRWIVNTTQEPIAYLGKDTHLHANSAYLSLFGFNSEAQLQASSIWDLIPHKSKSMFKDFIHKQSNKMDMQQSLLLTMNTIEGTKLRASIRIGSAVFNKSKCLQVWVHKVKKGLDFTNHISEHESKQVSPWETLPMRSTTSDGSKLSFSQLKSKLSHIEVDFSLLSNDTYSDTSHYLVSLNRTPTDIKRVDQLAKKMSSHHFWDSVLITEFIKKFKLLHDHDLQNNFLIELQANNIIDPNFIRFLLISLKSLEKRPSISILVPYSTLSNHYTSLKALNQSLKAIKCSLGVIDFTPSGHSIQQIMSLDPKYLIFSNKWLNSINEDDKRFTTLVNYLESKQVNIILP